MPTQIQPLRAPVSGGSSGPGVVTDRARHSSTQGGDTDPRGATASRTGCRQLHSSHRCRNHAHADSATYAAGVRRFVRAGLPVVGNAEDGTLPRGLRSRAGPLFLVKGSRARPQEAKADEVVAVGWIVPDPNRNTCVGGLVGMGTAPKDPGDARCSPTWISARAAAVIAAAVPILAPLPHISTHVVQATGVRRLGGYRVSGAA